MEEKTKQQLGKEHTTEKPALLCGYEEFKQGDMKICVATSEKYFLRIKI